MKFNFEQPNKENSRREFLKKLAILGASLFLPKSEEIKNNENIENLCINPREVWDTKWKEIKKQYEIPLGGEFSVKVGVKDYKKFASALSYTKHENKELKEVYKRIVIHHSALESKKNILEEVEGVRDFHVGKRGFDDIAYHFLIGKNGEIFEGRPIDRLGSNAGFTKESEDYFKKYLPEKAKDLKPSEEGYEERLMHYKKAIRQDPDYGSIGIVVLGNFETEDNPTEIQLESLKNLLNYLKGQYQIPKGNMIFHNEVKEKVVKASGKSLISPATACPGENLVKAFPGVREKLDPDSEEALCKNVLIEN